jgi:multiple sugar transport system ATP-binding protein
VAGLEQPDEGTVTIGGRPMNGVPPQERDVAMVFQGYALYPHMTVFENMGFALVLRKRSRAEIRDRVERAASILGLTDVLRRRPRQLSGGQRQRVAIGRAIVREPQVFLFDEPLSNLDAQLRLEMRREIATLHRQLGATTVYVTHDQVEAMTLGDRIVVLDAGRVQQIDTPLGLYHQPRNRFVASFIGSPPMNLIDGEIVAPQRPAGESAAFRSLDGALIIPISQALAERAGARLARRVTLGVRPEHITVRTVEGAGPASIRATLESVEPLGYEVLARVAIGAAVLTARIPPVPLPPPGTTVVATLDIAHICLFDGETGEALSAGAAAAG